MKCSDNCATIYDVMGNPGTVLHSPDHRRQALVISEPLTLLASEGYWVPALVFDMQTGERILESDSCVLLRLHDSDWHIAEHYTLGMDVPMPPPSIHITVCKYMAKTLDTDEVCDCGCGRVAQVKCDCDYCAECDGTCSSGERLCSECQDHGPCGCACDCDTTVGYSGELCGYCEDTSLCGNCGCDHDTNAHGLCDECQDIRDEEEEAERKAEEEEAARQLEEEGLVTVSAS